jgi:hypothetical protein
MFDDVLSLLAREISAQRAFEDAGAIHAIDRHFTFSHFQESARYSADRLREAGLGKVQIMQAPADGESLFGDWRMPMAWEVEAATFDLLFANGAWQRLVDRARTPQCLAMWSGPTPPEGVEAEIVLIENPLDRGSYDPAAARGKIVFTGAHPHQTKKLLADLGAVGVLSDYLHAPANLPHATAWVNSFSDDPGGWGFLKGDTPAWCFLISPNQGEMVRALVGAHGHTRLRGRALVRSRLEAGTVPAITGVIPGTTKEEVVLIGHQFEVGAIDNAAGVAIMIEAVRALQRLVSEGKLPAPKRSIRALFVSECYSNLYFWEKTRLHRRTVAGLCLDSPAGAPALAVRPLEIHANPHSQMSYTDALAVHLTEQVMTADPLYAWRETPFGMTDNLIADTSIGIPCPWLGGHSRTWHTSADTPELLPVAVMGLVAQITAAYAYLVATAGASEALDFAYLAAARGKKALADAAVGAHSSATSPLPAEALAEAGLDDEMNQFSYLADRHADAVASVLRLLPAGERAAARPAVRALQRQVRRAGREAGEDLARRAGRPGHEPPPTQPAPELAAIRPRRLVLGPITLDRLTPAQRAGRPSPRWSAAAFALLSWCNGKRSLGEACALAARELRQERALSPEELAKRIDPNSSSMLEYFGFLKQHGYVAW